MNLFNKFSTAISNEASTSNADTDQNLCDSTDDTVHQSDNESDDEVDTDNEDLDLDNDSTSESDSDTEIFDLATLINRTLTGNPLLQEYHDVGNAVWECMHCGACMWYQERKCKSKDTLNPEFQLCCRNDKIQLPLLKAPPHLLQHLLFNSSSPDSKHFQAKIRMYNSMFSFTSPGMNLHDQVNRAGGPPTMRLQGQPCHRIGSMLPEIGEIPKYAQLYIYDTENEIQNRIDNFRNNKDINKEIVTNLVKMLDDHNVLAKGFRMARDILKDGQVHNLKLKLISERTTDGRIYNQPTVSEVAALIVGDVDSGEKRDIILHERNGQLQRIDEFHPDYLSYQYPLLFPYGEDGYRTGILHKYQHETIVTKNNRLTIRDWLSFRIQSRKAEARTLLCSRRLYQQFLVDGFTMLEAERLNWLRKNQTKLRVGKYHRLNESSHTGIQNGQTKRGKRVVLPSSFVGSRRYLDQLYFDGMSISSHVGFPDIFITFTCNPNWPEIHRELLNGNLKPHDRPDIVARVFKMKFDALMKDLTKNQLLGKVLAYLYTIEFQKRGLPHAHILIFLHPKSKYPNPDDINRIISAEIPNPQTQKELYNLVKSNMMHGPCEDTIVDQDGFPVYRRRSNSHIIVKNGIELDNRHVVPYNPILLLKYRGHINMEWCNQRSSIKYLFKYIHKGYDRISATITSTRGDRNTEVDEIKEYLDCRMEQVLENPSVTESMFTSWLEANAKYSGARKLTYGDDKEFIEAINQAKDWGSGRLLRLFFVTMLLSSTMDRPAYVWSKTKHWLSDGILYMQRRIANNPGLNLTDEQIFNLTLLDIEKLLEKNRRTLKEFPSMPYPQHYITADLDEQRIIFEKIMTAVNEQKGGVFFLHGYGGTGKTYMWRTLSSAIRSKLQIVLNVASSGIASLLLPGGRTAHSKFKIPVPTEDNSTCNIEFGDDHSQLLQQTKLIIWDEAPMAHRYCFEALDRTMRDVMSEYGNSEHIFGGKVVVFGGDFRQILPVVPRGSRSDIVHASLKSSAIWNHVQVLTLTKNMRLQCGSSEAEKAEMKEFSEWILKVGEGKIAEPNDGIAEIEIPEELLITEFDDPILAIVNSTYPKLLDQYLDQDFLSNRAILASTIEVVEQINEFVLGLLPGEEVEYLSADSLDQSEVNANNFYDVLTPEFLNSLRTSGLPNHRIKLKIGTPIMLMRNIDQSEGLCNGTRLIVTNLAKYAIA
ncbi:helicase-like protein, partial [Trifolium medium]|nr:helicase-like protein [Trifolium medium]